MTDFTPSYLTLLESGELDRRIEELYSILSSCELCPRKCRVNRLEGETGFCRAPKELTVSSYNLHFGEEEPLVGSRSRIVSGLFGTSQSGGSGTIFLTYCNLLCVYCQNFDVSHLGQGRQVTEDRAARIMIELQEAGAHNINFVTPTHYAPQLIGAVRAAAEKGLSLPLVWNCGGYENVEIIRLLDGIVDIYMPDMKYADPEPAGKYSDAPDYFERCTESVSEMHRQVGDLLIDESGIAYRGLLIRHLVLPGNLAGSERILSFIADKISQSSYVNVMSQYRPVGMARDYQGLFRYPTAEEYYGVVETARRLRLTRGLQPKHVERF
jgi:putative pyruvate formate lyase activating enzyme